MIICLVFISTVSMYKWVVDDAEVTRNKLFELDKPPQK